MAETKSVGGYDFIRYSTKQYPPDEMATRSKSYFEWLNQRRSIRDFSDRPVSREVIANIIKSASTAPSGANKQPWTFAAVSEFIH